MTFLFFFMENLQNYIVCCQVTSKQQLDSLRLIIYFHQVYYILKLKSRVIFYFHFNFKLFYDYPRGLKEVLKCLTLRYIPIFKFFNSLFYPDVKVFGLSHCGSCKKTWLQRFYGEKYFDHTSLKSLTPKYLDVTKIPWLEILAHILIVYHVCILYVFNPRVAN